MIVNFATQLSGSRLAVAGTALAALLAWSQTADAQYSNKYGSPYGPWGGGYYGKYKNYDYDDEYGPKPESKGEMEPFKKGGGTPVLAVVGLDAQRVSIYDVNGKMILQSPVSTGQTGYETPAGVYSVVQKKADHNSNLYEDGNMPFMQRITWTGIAMHAGVLPGHPASHGCVRMPISFAQRLFELTDVGMRVVIVPNEIAAVDIEQPKLFKSDASPVSLSGRSVAFGSAEHVRQLKSIASSKTAAGDAATRVATEARKSADKKSADVTAATKALRAAETNQARAETLLKDADRDLEAANASTAPNAADLIKRAETAKQTATTRLADAETQLATAKSQLEAKTAAVGAAEEDAKKAEEAREAAVEVATEAERATLPVSVFISRKAQRLYVRQGYKPVFEGPVMIKDADKSLGTYVFSAFAHVDSRPHWNVVSMYSAKTGPDNVVRSSARKGDVKRTEALPADVDGARSALERITLPPQVMQRISSVVLPGSSLIISDESASIETGKDTDFVVIMSGEPQGGIKVRRKDPMPGWGGGGYYGGKGGGGPFSGFFFQK
jgi:L,D-transpeptidase catalytic domain